MSSRAESFPVQQLGMDHILINFSINKALFLSFFNIQVLKYLEYLPGIFCYWPFYQQSIERVLNIVEVYLLRFDNDVQFNGKASEVSE